MTDSKESVLFYKLFFHLSGAAFHHTVALQHGGDGTQEALYIQGEGFPAAFVQNLSVVAVQAGFYIDFQFIAAVNLCPAGKARSHIVGTVFVTLFHQVELIPQSRTRSDDAHAAYKDIKNLRQFVQTGFS